ncbi:MAG: hypothetical protein EBU46_02910, partial [Nitrosomonadaceae bacterium]|nr:hypothetical protein [Nitrosomonadaceae bacterium]
MAQYPPQWASYDNYKHMSTSPVMRSFGYAPLDMAAMTMLGNKMLPYPQPNTTQNMVDAMTMRQRTMDFMQVRNQSFGSNLLAARYGGLNTQSPLYQMGANFFADPDGPVARMMAPLIGGNPMKASMGLYANMTGQAMSTFGQQRNYNVDDVSRHMEGLGKFFYKPMQVTDDTRFKNQRQIATEFEKAGLSGELNGMFGVGNRLNASQRNRFAQETNLANQAVDIARISDPEEKRKASKVFLDAIDNPDFKRKFGDALAGGQDADGLAATFKVKARNALLTQLDDHGKLKDGATRPGSINYGNTRGFQLEDFTKGFQSAALNRLFSGKDLKAAEVAFAPNAAGVMDAGRGVFGNRLNGGEMMDSISRLLGSSHVDMGNKGEASKLTKFLQDIKALAQTADISVDTIVGTIEEARKLAESHPALKYMGGLEVGGLSLEAIKSANVQASVLSNDFVRRKGGVAGLVQEQVGGVLHQASQPITKQLAAAQHYFSTRGDVRSMEMINNYANNGDRSALGMARFFGQMAGRAGMSAADFLNYTREDTTAQALGLRANPNLVNASAGSALQTIRQMVMRSAATRGWSRGDINRTLGSFENALGVNGDPERAKALLARTGVLGMHGFNELYNENIGAITKMQMERNPLYRKLMADQQLRMKDNAADNDRYSRVYGHVFGPTSGAFFNQLLNGSIGEEGIEGFLQPIKEKGNEAQVGPMRDLLRKHQSLFSRVGNRQKTASELADALKAADSTTDIDSTQINPLQRHAAKLNDLLKKHSINGAGTVAELVASLAESADPSQRLAQIQADLPADVQTQAAFTQMTGASGLGLATNAGNLQKTIKGLGFNRSYRGNFSDEDVRGSVKTMTEAKLKESFLKPKLDSLDSQFKTTEEAIYRRGAGNATAANKADATTVAQLRRTAKESGLTSPEQLQKILKGDTEGLSGAEKTNIGEAQRKLANLWGVDSKDLAQKFKTPQLAAFTASLNQTVKAKSDIRAVAGTQTPEDKIAGSTAAMQGLLEKLLASVSG